MNDKKTLLFPFMLITVGAGWLLNTLGIVPGVNWVWSLGLVAVGLLAMVIGGFDKFSLVVTPFFMLAGLLSVLRQKGIVAFDVEVPVLTIVAGVLMLVARSPSIPVPKWIIQDGPPRKV